MFYGLLTVMAEKTNGVANPGPGSGELFQYFRDQVPKTRAQLATLTGLSRSTVGGRLDALVELGLIASAGGAHSTGGRPSSLFALATESRWVVGVDLGARHATVGIADLSGKLLVETTQDIEISEGPTIILELVISIVRDLLAQKSLSVSSLLSLGIGVPGPVEHLTGKPATPPIMPGWDGFDIPGWVGSRLGIPVLVDNDVNLMALGERSMAWPQVDDLMFVKVSTGIGSGIISGGLLQRGAQGTAGDIGHIQISGDEVKACHCGNHGCLEANAAGPAVISSLQRSGVAVSSTTELIALVRQGNIDAIGAVREAGRKIGEVLAMSVSMINPSVIVLGGSMAQAGEHLIAGVREIVYLRSMPLASSHLAIVASRAAQQAGVIGAAIMALEHSLSAENIDAMLNQTELSK